MATSAVTDLDQSRAALPHDRRVLGRAAGGEMNVDSERVVHAEAR